MSRKISTLIVLVVLMSMLFSACAPTPTPTAVAPVAVATNTAVPPTATPVPPTPTPEPAPDVEVLWSELIASIPGDKGYGAVSASKLNEELVEKPPFLLDVRETAEVEKEGYILGSVHVPVRDVLKNLDKLPAMDAPIVVYCASGHRGGYVLSALRALGYTNVRNLGGGLGSWKKAELPVETGLPEAPAAGTAPEIENQALLTLLDDWMTNLPNGFMAVSADAVNVDLAESAPFLVDLRPAKDLEAGGWIAGMVNIPFEDLYANLDQLPAKDEPIILYCGSGHRGAIALMGLHLMGYENILNLGGGMGAWKAAKFPVAGWIDWNVTWGDFLADLPEGFYGTSAANLNVALTEEPPFLLDVREASELEKEGFIAGAVHLPVRTVLQNLHQLPALDEPIVVYCASGHRGALVVAALRLLGYEDVVNLGGGMGAWKKAELPVETGAPAEPVDGEAPMVDVTLFRQLDAYLSGLPDGFSTIKAADLNAALVESEPPFVLDVRTADEVAADGVIEGSVVIEVKELFTRLEELPADKTAPIVVLCKSGHRGALALMALNMNGYTDVRNLGGGINSWIAADLPVVELAVD